MVRLMVCQRLIALIRHASTIRVIAGAICALLLAPSCVAQRQTTATPILRVGARVQSDSTSKIMTINPEDPQGEAGWKEEYTVELKYVSDARESFGIRSFALNACALSSSPSSEIMFRAPACARARRAYGELLLEKDRGTLLVGGLLKRGNERSNRIAVALDIDKMEKGAKTCYDVRFDFNRDGDLTNDSALSDLRSNAMNKVESFVNYTDGTTDPCTLCFNLAENEGALILYYFICSGRWGILKADQKNILVLLYDPAGKGVYSDSRSAIEIDQKLSGRLGPAPLRGANEGLYRTLELPGACYRVSGIDAAGRRLTLRRNHSLELANMLKELGSKGKKAEPAWRETVEKFSASLPEDAQTLHKEARRWMSEAEGNYDAAVVALRKASRLKPESAGLINILANAELKAGQYGDAIAHFKTRIEMKDMMPSRYLKTQDSDSVFESDEWGVPHVNLMTALALRNKPGDVDEAYRQMVAFLDGGMGAVDFPLSQAWQTLKEAGEPSDSKLKEQALRLLDRPAKDWNRLDWSPDYQEALEEAREENKPLLVLIWNENAFWASGPMDPIFGHPVIWEKLSSDFILCRLDFSKNHTQASPLATKFLQGKKLAGRSLSALPVMGVVSPQETVLFSTLEFLGAKVFNDWIIAPFSKLDFSRMPASDDTTSAGKKRDEILYSGRYRKKADGTLELAEKTDRIPCRAGEIFGFTIRYDDASKNESALCRLEVTHPPHPQRGDTPSTKDVWRGSIRLYPQADWTYQFSTPQELVPGDYTIKIKVKARAPLSQTFKVGP